VALVPADLVRELADPAKRRVRENLIAAATATEVECPHCYAGVGQACVTFPRGTDAQFTHAKRLSRRLAGVRAGLR
jgi:hypothetical protein